MGVRTHPGMSMAEGQTAALARLPRRLLGAYDALGILTRHLFQTG